MCFMFLNYSQTFLKSSLKTYETHCVIRAFFQAILYNLFDLDETAVRGVFEVAKLEYVLKIEPAILMAAFGPIFAQNLGLTPKHI